MPVFGRTVSGHRYDDAIRQLTDSTNEIDRALAANLAHDHRVSVGREKSFDSFVDRHCLAQPVSAEILKNALDEYLRTKVRGTPLPEFMDPDLNGHNLLDAGAGVKVRSNQMLARLLDLNGFYEIFDWGKENRITAFSQLPNQAHEIGNWLAEQLNGILSRDDLIAAICEAYNGFSRAPDTHRPAWVTTWRCFRRYFEHHPPHRWFELMGVPEPAGTWVAVLRYPVHEAGRLVRPTQLDAGAWGFHFPSPPAKPLALGGCVMDLRGGSRVLRSEFVHRQIELLPRHFVAIRRTTEPTADDIARRRRAHRDRLDDDYPSTGWIS